MTITPTTLTDGTTCYELTECAGGPYHVRVRVVETKSVPRGENEPADTLVRVQAYEVNHDTGEETGKKGDIIGMSVHGDAYAFGTAPTAEAFQSQLRYAACSSFVAINGATLITESLGDHI